MTYTQYCAITNVRQHTFHVYVWSNVYSVIMRQVNDVYSVNSVPNVHKVTSGNNITYLHSVYRVNNNVKCVNSQNKMESVNIVYDANGVNSVDKGKT